MNTTDTFFNRDQSIAKVNMAMNYLSRLVRENMTIFDYDSTTGKTSFLTNSDRLVTCVVVTEGSNVSLKDVEVEDATEVFSNERIDEGVDGFVSGFIESLKVGEYGGAEKGFSDLLGAFESRSKVNESRSKLERRRNHFNEAQEILSTPEFIKLSEVKDNLVSFLEENREGLLEYEDVINSVRLTNALGKAFNSARKTWEEVVEEGTMVVPYDSKKTVFEMICTQELIRSELTESKENFARSWVKNPKIAALASCIYNDDAKVSDALTEAVQAVPYLALASKADIKEVFASIYESSDVANISQKDVREYVGRIFEFKKPIKTRVIKELNESYGINVQNLKFVPSFANLSKAQSVLFEALSKLGGKETVVKDVLFETSKMLRKKNGIETLDLNDFVSHVFGKAGIFESAEFYRDVNLDTVVDAVLDEKWGDKKGDKSNVKKDAKDKGDYETGARKGDKSNQKSKKGDKGDYETGARKGDKGDGSHPDRKDFETEKGNSNFGGNKGDKSKTHKGKDFETEDGNSNYGGNKGDKSKTHAGKDFEKNGNGNGDDENGDPKAFGGKKGDKSKTHKGKDFETEDGNSNYGGNKGDKSKTHPGELDYEDDDAKAKDEFPLAKDKDGKKKKKKKGGGLSDSEADAAEDQTAYDESIEYAEPEEETDFGSGLSDEGMTELMGELENLFKEIDWNAIAEDEVEDGDVSDGNDYSDEMTERTPNEFSDEEVGTPSQDEAP